MLKAHVPVTEDCVQQVFRDCGFASDGVTDSIGEFPVVTNFVCRKDFRRCDSHKIDVSSDESS